MKFFKNVLPVFATVLIWSTASGQTTDLLENMPDTESEYVATEKNAIATINWLENTPLNEEVQKRKDQYALLLSWITNSPSVTIEVNSNITTFTRKNADLLMIFMGGWAKYSLENGYSKDIVKGNLAGIKSAIKVYKNGVGIRKDKAMLKIIELDDKGELESWINAKLAGKMP